MATPTLKPEDETRIKQEARKFTDDHGFTSMEQASDLAGIQGATRECLRSYGIEEELAIVAVKNEREEWRSQVHDCLDIIKQQQAELESLRAERDELKALVNQPEIEDFLKGVQLEAAHQTERWGLEDEERKPPHHFVMVITKIAGKMCVDVWDRNFDKFKHHCIALAAEMFNVHRQTKKETTEIFNWFNHPLRGDKDL